MKKIIIIMALLFALPAFGAELAGYTILWGTTPGGPYIESCSTTDSNATSATCVINGVAVDFSWDTATIDSLYFVIQAITDEGDVSPYSNEVVAPIVPAPTNFRITSQ